jgi:hypothetical protein
MLAEDARDVHEEALNEPGGVRAVSGWDGEGFRRSWRGSFTRCL